LSTAAAAADVKVGFWQGFLDVFLRLQVAHRVLGFPSLHTEGFQQASRWKLIDKWVRENCVFEMPY
jgi:hypothetical protein